MAQVSLTFPDGNARSYDAGVTPAEVAASISTSLAKKAISATVNGAHWDLQWPIDSDAAIAIHTMTGVELGSPSPVMARKGQVISSRRSA